MAKKKIVHLSILNGAGGGHKSATYATIEALDKYYPGKYEHIVVDIMELINPKIRLIIEKAYENIASKTKSLYRALFTVTHKTVLPANIDRRIYPLIKKDLEKIIKKDTCLIISYFPFFTISIRRYLNEKGYNIPFITQITDTGEVHSAWMDNSFDYYLALTEETKFWLKEKGIDESKVKVFGFPLRQDFYKKMNKGLIRKKIGVGDEPFIYYFNSGWTVGNVVRKAIEIDNTVNNVSMLIGCGRNEELKEELKGIKFNNNIIIKGFINNVPEILHACDLVIAKAGGASTAEIIKSKTPSLITEVVPGQEEPNARFIESMGFGYVEKTPKKLAKRVKYILESNDIKRMKTNLENYHTDDYAVKNIVKFINSLT